MASEPYGSKLTAYARLLLDVGVNLRPGQKLLLRGSVDVKELVRSVAEQAYERGCPYVDVVWLDDHVQRSRFLKGPNETFDVIDEHRAAAANAHAEEGSAVLTIVSSDPHALDGVSAKNLGKYEAKWRAATAPYMEKAMTNAFQWCVAGAAGPGWARRVFPELSPAEAEERLWAAIFQATRMNEADPVAAWRKHNEELDAAVELLNARRYSALRFTGEGTDLEVGLADGHIWAGGGSSTPSGVEFVANMPTEEVFTAPHRTRVNGVVRASMPLSHGGTLIEGFTLTFEGGKVVGVKADKGQEMLQAVLNTDEGARRLGEVALVPASSPIAKAGSLFLNTLFDENAASHLALGKGYDFTLEGAEAMSAEEKLSAGLNDSAQHVDFMIGTHDMDVDGVKQDGSTEPVMRAGEWAT